MPPLTSSNPPTSLTSSNSSNHIHIQTLTPSPHPPHHQHHPTRNSHLDQGRRTEQKSNNLFKLSNLVSRSCVRNKFNNINQPTRIFCFSWRILLPKHKGLGLPQVEKKYSKENSKKNYRTQKSTQKRRCTLSSTQKSTHKINTKEIV